MTITERKLTAADLAALPTRLPTGTVRYELQEGELRVMSPTGDVHGVVEARITTVLTVHGEWQGHGQVRSGEVGVVLWHDPDTVVGVDVAFLTSDQLPVRRSPEGYLETVPALVVEVVSKNDRRKEITDRVNDYLAAGVRAVWIANPRRRVFDIHRQGESPLILREGDTLTAEGIIPGLALPISRLFEGL